VIKEKKKEDVEGQSLCRHCGDSCDVEVVKYQEMDFCCEGCKTVYILLNEKGLNNYYTLDDLPGISFKNKRQKIYDFLENEEIIDILVDATINNISRLTFQIPSIHCSSCIWLLENLHQLNPGIHSCRVNFLKKNATIQYDNEVISLREVVELLASIGYEPDLSMVNLDKNQSAAKDHSLLYKIGVAGFCFGNIMLLSFPDYLGIVDTFFHRFISTFMVLLSLPVLLYSGWDYLASAYKSLRSYQLAIDVPVALGMCALYFRSLYEILSGSGSGYMDSFTGFVFFLLIGKWFQNFTHESLSFDRNYKSYFPISAYVLKGEEWIIKTINNVLPGERILIKNQEIIPCDGVLMEGQARLDYSFVTGEADLIRVDTGEKVFAGGKQNGASLVIDVKKRIDQSYLTELWNSDAFQKLEESQVSTIINGISKYFTLIIIAIAAATLWYWWGEDLGTAFNAFTAVLIIACPCVLALSIPFLYGNAIRILGHSGAYFKNVNTLEKLQDIDVLVFDKTGTITDNSKRKVVWNGKPLTLKHKQYIKSLCIHSSHPLSKSIVDFLDVPVVDITGYEEKEGLGLVGKVSETIVKLGSTKFILDHGSTSRSQQVIVQMNGDVIGHFSFENSMRDGISEIITTMKKNCKISLLSGDNDHDLNRMRALFPEGSELRFYQSPQEKLDFIKGLQKDGMKVLMIGDGLNDAGALKQSDVGLVIADNINNFTPASDIIMDARAFSRLGSVLTYSRYIRYALYGAFVLAVLYNGIGLYFAVGAKLSPIVAAILMPISSISIILYGVVVSKLVSMKILE
jgi:Cu+-exporting ATPase